MSDLPVIQFARWLGQWPQLSVGLVVLVVMASALGVVYTTHLSRGLYVELQALEAEQDQLDGDYERLLLEQGAIAGYATVDQTARNELSMDFPRVEDIVVLEGR